MKTGALLAAFVGAAFAFAPEAYAWDSHCDPDCEAAGAEGKVVARARMRDDANQKDEHRRIWLETLRLGGAPADADYTLRSFVVGDSYNPSSFLDADTIVERLHAPSEFTMLPDFSFSLWDWASGNETCPLTSPVFPEICHSFVGHMGATNSNHFLPQTKTNYLHYHALAMDRARECADLRQKVAGRAELDRFVKACVQEALILEAIGHHFLQDSWSSGHTWERWGSPNESDFPGSVIQAGAVAAISGLIHGGRALLQKFLPEGSDANDAMCAPWPEVMYSSAAGPTPAIGDLYLPTMLAGANGTYASEYHGLFGCAVGSVRAVLTAAGEPLQGVTGGITPVDPSVDASCFGSRSTNAALRKGFAIEFIDTNHQQQTYTLDGLATGAVILTGVLSVAQPLPQPQAALTPLLTFDLLKIGANLSIRSAQDPAQTDLANGGMGTLLGVSPNGTYDRLGTYIDPPLPWAPAGAAPSSEELALLRQFHESHARDWCGLFKEGAPELDLARLRDRVTSTTGAMRDVACDLCVEFAERHLRIGQEDTYTPGVNPEPLCSLVASQPNDVQYVYAPDQRGGGTSRQELAREYCGCHPLEASLGTFHHEVTGDFQTALLARLRVAGTPPADDVSFTVEGPSGWNGGAPATLTYPHGFIRQFFVVPTPPLSGTYTVKATVDGQEFRVQRSVDATQILPAAQSVTPDLTVANQIGATWSAAAGAGSYLARAFDTNIARILTPVLFTTSTSGTLSNVPLNGAHTNALQVWTFSNDMRPADPPMPAQFNLSFNRTLLNAKVTVTGGGTVAASSVNALSATVTGLSGTEVTWQASGGTLTPNGTRASWQAPPEVGVYRVTATATANPIFRTSVTYRVTSGSSCSAASAGQALRGTWRIVGAYQVAYGRDYADCTKIGACNEFSQGGTMSVDSAGTVKIAGMADLAGGFACSGTGTPAYSGGGGSSSFGTGTDADAFDLDTIRGQLTLHIGKYVPIVLVIEAVRD